MIDTNLVPTFDTSVKLKELGFQPTHFGWSTAHIGPKYKEYRIAEEYEPGDYPAPTFEEVWKELPTAIGNYCKFLENDNCIGYIDRNNEDTPYLYVFESFAENPKSLAEMCAMMWIWLKTSKYIKDEYRD